MNEIALTVDGQEVRTDSGTTVLQAALGAGIYIPSLCHYPGLKPLPEVVPDRACQLCLVEVGGDIRLSCATEVSQGMVVRTETPRVRELRQKNLLSLLRRHPNACLNCHRQQHCRPFDVCLRHVAVQERCVLCPQNGACELQCAVECIGIEDELPTYIPKGLTLRDDSPFFLRDHNLCILCERCVRVCEDVRRCRAIEFAYPCHRACPAGIDIPRYVRLIARGRPGAALAVIREKVPFPGALGRVCIHPCEGACQRGLVVEHPLHIRMLKRFASDNGDDSWKTQSKKLPPSGRKMAVVGAGPAGLTAAYYLAKLGHEVTVFEALPEPGGMMRVGIPEYRLSRQVLSSEIDEIRAAGVEIRLNTRIESIDSLFEQGYDAVFLGLGAHQGMSLGIEGDDLPGVIESAEFLRRANLGERVEVGERVGVIGGGNVAIDAARLSLRLGAKKVYILYRRTRAEMPASPEEVDAALEEGVDIEYLVAPSKMWRDGDVLKLECLRMELGEPDASGRRRPVPISGSEFVTDLDNMIAAIGQRPQVPEAFGVEVGRGNTVSVNSDMRSSREGVFSGGDCVSGPASVIEAIDAGRKAAEAIDIYLGGVGDISEQLVNPEEALYWPEGNDPEERLASLSHLSPEASIGGFEEVEHGFDRDTAVAEALRCLQCHVIAPPDERTLDDAGCKFCGACVDACPTGALVELSARWVGTPEQVVTTVCPSCGVGCQLKLEVGDGRITKVVPDPKGPANRGQACVKGKFGLDFVHDSRRLTSPLIKKDGRFVEASWDEALELVSARLSQFKGNQFAAISSARATNEDNYIIQKFARAVMGTNSIDHCACLSHAPAVDGLATSFGSGAMTNSIREIGEASCILAVSTNTTEDHPVIALEVYRAVEAGGKLIIASSVEIDLCRSAAVWLRHLPGTEVALLMGMTRVIVDDGLLDEGFIQERCEGLDVFRESLKGFDLERVSEITGVPAADIAEAARIYASSRPGSILYAMDITRHSHGRDSVFAIANLAMLTGNVGKPSSGVNPLMGQNNVQGTCDMGALPDVYAGYQQVADPQARGKFEAAWGCSLPSEPGMTISDIFAQAGEGKVKAVYLVGENPVPGDFDAARIREALERLEFLVVQDMFLTETAELADVVLPSASFAEKDGTFTNTERRVQRVRQALPPVGGSLPGWKIASELAKRMGGKDFDYNGPLEIMDEVRGLTPGYGGISYSRLEDGGLQWPCPDDKHPGTALLHAGEFVRGLGRFVPLEYKPPLEQPDR
ncbi:FAD-dependent oxidoreductase [Chloroflexota bacterium]